MYFGIYNCYAIKNLKLSGKKTILVRCLSESEYVSSPPIINNSDAYSNILKLNVNDTNVFDLNNAKLLNEFIMNNDFDEVITHCALGISRSPAVMICISKILQSKDMEQLIKENYRFYNKAIVETFENFSYQTKHINDTNFILRESYKPREEDKILIKKGNYIIR